MDNKIFVCVLIFLSCMGLQVIDATMCKPLSKFKIDCNTCFCSRDGARYTCTRNACRGEPSGFQFINDEGYDDDPVAKNDKDYGIPYINDEIPQSKEDWDYGPNGEVNPDDYLLPLRSEVDDPRFDKAIQDVDTEDQDAEDMNNDFRFKREIFV